MSISSPIDVITPATRRRQALAQQLQQQFNANRGGQKKLQSLNAQALHALPLFRGAGGRDSATLPNAPQPQLTVPYMQDPGTTNNLGVVNPASPQDPNVSQAPGQGAPGYRPPGYDISAPTANIPGNFPDPGAGVPNTRPTGADISPPTAGQGLYADGSPAAQPIMDPNMVLRNFSSGNTGGVRRLVGVQQPNSLMQMMAGFGASARPGQMGYY